MGWAVGGAAGQPLSCHSSPNLYRLSPGMASRLPHLGVSLLPSAGASCAKGSVGRFWVSGAPGHRPLQHCFGRNTLALPARGGGSLGGRPLGAWKGPAGRQEWQKPEEGTGAWGHPVAPSAQASPNPAPGNPSVRTAEAQALLPEPLGDGAGGRAGVLRAPPHHSWVPGRGCGVGRSQLMEGLAWKAGSPCGPQTSLSLTPGPPDLGEPFSPSTYPGLGDVGAWLGHSPTPPRDRLALGLDTARPRPGGPAALPGALAWPEAAASAAEG